VLTKLNACNLKAIIRPWAQTARTWTWLFFRNSEKSPNRTESKETPHPRKFASRMGKKRLRGANGHSESDATAPKKKLKSSSEATITTYEQRLGDENREVRTKAAVDLLRWVQQSPEANAEFIENVLTKLAQALCKPISTPKAGYFMALTELLRQLYPERAYPESTILTSDVPRLTKVIGRLDAETYKPFDPVKRFSHLSKKS
jgi:hypothetical protein